MCFVLKFKEFRCSFVSIKYTLRSSVYTVTVRSKVRNSILLMELRNWPPMVTEVSNDGNDKISRKFM